MLWQKTKNYTKQILKEANLDPVPYAKDRLKSEFAKALLEPLPVEQIDLGDSVQFQAEAIVLSLPEWKAIKEQLNALPALNETQQRETLSHIINSVEKQPEYR
ncbi:hypothetical protein GCM10028806_31110 [Spirosoma terrae]|uniref:Uncharacterized protein n=1 Tax=Spirosoma terrae TaxID=1968276 RepID=A0A6L9L443_9BACT|nr:hypothetical protein [Spirosoma terrae]NDU95425.1 hypothetical protein [Spirosoma terrae]